MRFLILGGDSRNIMLAQCLAHAGHNVQMSGLGNDSENQTPIIVKIKEAINSYDYIVGPLPFTIDGENLHMPLSKDTVKLNDLIDIFTGNKVLIAGKIPVNFTEKLIENDIAVYDYLDRDEMSILNSIPTAEGAIQIAMEELPITIHGVNALVLGYGKTGKTLAGKLHALGANTYVCARKSVDFALCEVNNLYSTDYKKVDSIIQNMDVIFNTVPAIVLDSTRLSHIRRDCLIIDLASKPGGCDFDYAKENGIKIIHALSLPGKVAPITAANILYKVIEHIIDERS